MKFLKTLRLDSCRASILLSASESSLMLLVLWISWCVEMPLEVFYLWEFGGWLSDMWRSLIGDMCHSLIGGALRLFHQDTWHLLIGQNVLIFKITHANTRLDYLCHCLHTPMCDWFFLHVFYVSISMILGKFLLVSE